MAFQHLSLFCCCLLLGGALAKRLPSHKPDQSSRVTVHDLNVELTKTQTQLQRLIEKERAGLPEANQTAQIQDSCTNIKSVGEPVTHNSRHYDEGAWMKDPLGIMGTETIFVMEYYGRHMLQEFENMDKFKEGVTRKTYTLPYNWDGTGAVVYGPYLYYNRANSSDVEKYSLLTERIEATISVKGYTPRNTSYPGCKGYCGMDLAVDEQGLWLLWASTGNSGKLYASKIDVYDNVITKTWTLSTEPMSSMGNAFVACGVIYCIDAYNSKYTTINFAYDTKTGEQWNPNIQFTNLYQYNSMVDYNPREKVLYAWDKKRQVTYSLTFEKD